MLPIKLVRTCPKANVMGPDRKSRTKRRILPHDDNSQANASTKPWPLLLPTQCIPVVTCAFRPLFCSRLRSQSGRVREDQLHGSPERSVHTGNVLSSGEEKASHMIAFPNTVEDVPITLKTCLPIASLCLALERAIPHIKGQSLRKPTSTIFLLTKQRAGSGHELETVTRSSRVAPASKAESMLHQRGLPGKSGALVAFLAFFSTQWPSVVILKGWSSWANSRGGCRASNPCGRFGARNAVTLIS